MQNTHLRHLLHLLRYQIATGMCLLLSLQGTSQRMADLNMEEHDQKPYYFGITLGYNQSFFKLYHSARFLQQDTILVVAPLRRGGFNLGLLGNLRLNERFDLRINPSLIFGEKSIQYVIKQDSSILQQRIESILLSFPLQVKFKSDRIGNFRFYALGGLKFDYDLASNARASRAEELVKVNRSDYGYEWGVGFEFYLPSFIFSPELKISNGLGNVHTKDDNLKFSNVIDRLNSRMIVFSIHLEG